MTWILATSGALLIGILTNLIYDLVKNQGGKLPARLDRRSLPSVARRYDVNNDGLTALITWSESRRLARQRVITEFAGRLSRSHLFSGEAWDEEVARLIHAGKAGRTAYIAGIQVDTHEHPEASKLRVTVAESRYAESLAAAKMATLEGAEAKVSESLLTGLENFVQVAPPSSVTASISVLSSKNELLTLRRSLSVETFTGQWTIGINETMKYSDEPGASEDFFALAYRGLEEELGLRRDDCGPINFTWLGWSHKAMCWVLVAIVKVNLTSDEVEERRANCHSIYEHDALAWIPFTRKVLADIITGRSSGPDGVRPWSYLAPLLALETWRGRGLL